MKNKILKTISYILVIAFSFFAFFYRTHIDGENTGESVSGGMISVVILALLTFVFLLHKAINIRNPSLKFGRYFNLSACFFLVAIVATTISYFGNEYSTSIYLNMTREILIIASVFFVGYYTVKSRIIPGSRFLYIIGVLALITMYIISQDLTGYDSIRRLEAFGGLNYTASIFAIATLIWLSFLLGSHTNDLKGKLFFFLEIFGFLSCLSMTFLQGSRSALAGLCMSILVLLFFKRISVRNMFVIFSIFVLGIYLYGSISSRVNLENLLNRFSMDFIESSGHSRLAVFEEPFVVMRASDFFFGRPDFYDLLNPNAQQTLHPHNILISALSFFGMFSFFVLILGLTKFIFAKIKACVKLFLMNTDKEIMYRLLISALIFFLALLYVSFSGRITRVFHFYFFYGFAIGIFERYFGLGRFQKT